MQSVAVSGYTLEVEGKKEDAMSNVESDVCIIYFNIIRSSRINRLLLHPISISSLLCSFASFYFYSSLYLQSSCTQSFSHTDDEFIIFEKR